jgi:hypothetical protein
MAKLTDDPDAKYKLWAENAKVYAFPRIANLPRFGVKRFGSHEEMNAWKEELLRELARQGGARWMR